jgi:hypothetical protein
MTTEEVKKEIESATKTRKTCKTCDKRVYVDPAATVCPICNTPFRAETKCPECDHVNPKNRLTCEECGAHLFAGGKSAESKVTTKKEKKIVEKRQRKIEREQKKAEKKEKKERKVKEVSAELIKKVAAYYPDELKSSSAIARKLGVERKLVQRSIRQIKKGA